MTKYTMDEIKMITINENIDNLSKMLLSGNILETIFVIDLEHHLQGIITKGDFLRKIDESENISDIMNKSHAKIKYTSDETNQIKQSSDIFEKNPKINEIPVIDNNGKLLYVLKRKCLRKYKFETIERILELCNKNELHKLLYFFEQANIKTLAIVIEDNLLSILWDSLAGHMDVQSYRNYDELLDTTNRKTFDLILMHSIPSVDIMRFKLGKGVMLLDCNILISFFDKLNSN